LHSILESLPQIAFTLKGDGKTEFVNELWYQYAKDITTFPPIHPDDKEVCAAWNKALAAGEPLITEVRLKHISSNDYRYHLLKIMPIKQGSTITKWVGTFTDIHPQKLAAELLEQKVQERTQELQESNQELETSNHELQQFASVASHDLKEPLRKINVFGSMMKEKFQQNDPKGAVSYVDRIIESAQRMSQLINDLLNYSRLSASAHYIPTDLNRIVAEIVTDLEIIIKEKEAVLHIGDLPVVDAIPGQMRQMLQNLISNALKFSKKGTSPVITIGAELIEEKDINGAATTEGSYCRITVADNGIGFNERYLDKIFTIFQRLNNREEYDGTGIGLAVTKKIIDKHNGLITARSQENEGATFIIVLPLHHTPHPVEATVSK
jgi:light-regulated signal transduction histidine kinase (bacteriophytochrome)